MDREDKIVVRAAYLAAFCLALLGALGQLPGG